MKNDFLKDVKGNESTPYFSYYSLDRERVLPIIMKLQSHGIAGFIPDPSIISRGYWKYQMSAYIKRCSCFVAFISERYLQSSFCEDALLIATQSNKKIFPVYLEEVTPTGRMQQLLVRMTGFPLYDNNNEQQLIELLSKTISEQSAGAGASEHPKTTNDRNLPVLPYYGEKQYSTYIPEVSEQTTDPNDLVLPCPGREPYIFISYSHKDADVVLPILRRMQNDGFRFWYDDGIDPGTEWDENIAEHVLGCGYFIAMISNNYIASKNCKDELSFARDEDKESLLIYLEETKLPKGMRMRFGRLQAVYFCKYASRTQFFEKLYSAKHITHFRKTGSGQ